jgi:hypothetical protein
MASYNRPSLIVHHSSSITYSPPIIVQFPFLSSIEFLGSIRDLGGIETGGLEQRIFIIFEEGRED